MVPLPPSPSPSYKYINVFKNKVRAKTLPLRGEGQQEGDFQNMLILSPNKGIQKYLEVPIPKLRNICYTLYTNASVSKNVYFILVYSFFIYFTFLLFCVVLAFKLSIIDLQFSVLIIIYSFDFILFVFSFSCIFSKYFSSFFYFCSWQLFSSSVLFLYFCGSGHCVRQQALINAMRKFLS